MRIAHGTDLDAAAGDGLTQDVHPPPAGADDGGAIRFVRISTENMKRRQSERGSAGSDEMAAVGHRRRV